MLSQIRTETVYHTVKWWTMKRILTLLHLGLLDSLVSHQIYRDAKECLNLLSQRLGTSQFFFGDTWVCFSFFCLKWLTKQVRYDSVNTLTLWDFFNLKECWKCCTVVSCLTLYFSDNWMTKQGRNKNFELRQYGFSLILHFSGEADAAPSC